MKKRKKGKKPLDMVLIALLVLLVLVAVVLMVRLVQMSGEYLEEQLYLPRDGDDRLMYEAYVDAASEAYEVDKAIIYAVIYCESNFAPDATSSVGAMGLMQMMPTTFEEMQGYLKEDHDTEALYDPEINIRYGTYYLSRLYRIFGDWETVYAAYNAGPTKVLDWLEDERYAEDGKLTDIPYSETAHYVEKVGGTVEKYKEIFQTEEQNDT